MEEKESEDATDKKDLTLYSIKTVAASVASIGISVRRSACPHSYTSSSHSEQPGQLSETDASHVSRVDDH